MDSLLLPDESLITTVESMILLTLNRCAGCNFVRFMRHRYSVEIKENIVPGENLVVLEVSPEEVQLFREQLTKHPQHYENATGILRMLGTSTQ